MNVSESSARELLGALGYKNAPRYTVKVLEEKLAGVPAMPADTHAAVPEGPLRRLLRTLIDASRYGPPKVLRGDIRPAPPEGPPPKPEPPDYEKGSRRGVSVHYLTADKEAAPGSGGKPKKQGIQYHLFAALKGAMPRAVLKDDLLAMLAAKFPGRSAASMAITVNGIPSWLPERYPAYEVFKDGKAYGIREAEK